MAEELFIPKLGQTVEEVTIVNWLAEEGTKVEFGQPILEVETDKAVFPVEANANGYLHLGSFQPGQVVPVLTVVATIGKKDELFSPLGVSVETEPERASSAHTAEPETGPMGSSEPVSGDALTGEEKPFASPRAKRLGREKHVDLSKVKPSGGQGIRIIEKDVLAYLNQLPKVTPVAQNIAAQTGLNLSGMAGSGLKGTITKLDVEKALKDQTPTPAETGSVVKAAPAVGSAILPTVPESEVIKTVPLTGLKGIIFERMGNSVHTTARVTLMTEVDATDFVAAREKLKESVTDAWGFAPGYNDLLGVMVARSLREFSYMNARVRVDGAAIEWLSHVNLGMAVDTERGLLVPVVQDADMKGLREFGVEFRSLVDRARASRSLPSDLSGGTFTITNLGMFDVDAFTPVINLPEAAILGVGRIQPKVVPYKGEIVIRQMLSLSLVFDHRLVDGAPAARFLQRIKQYVENPLLLLG